MAPTDPEPHARLRHILSWCEKTRTMLAEAQQTDDTRRIAWLQAVLRLAESLLAKEKARQKEAIIKMGEGLQVQLHTQEGLQAEVNQGKLTPEQAKMSWSELQRRAQAYRADIDDANTELRAKSSEDLGGFVDAPLAAYAEKLGVRLPAMPKMLTPHAVNVRIALVALVVGIIAVGVVAYSMLGMPALRMYVERQAHLVHVRVVNDLLKDVTVLIPWPDDAAKLAHPDGYGVELRMRPVGETDFRVVALSPSAWTRDGVPTVQQEPVALSPKLDTGVTLDLRKVVGVDPAATPLQIVLTNASGRIISRVRLNE